MKNVSVALAATLVINFAHAQELNQFQSGDVATAEAFNHNFNTLKAATDKNEENIEGMNLRIQSNAESLQSAVDEIKSGEAFTHFVDATVNNVAMKVSTQMNKYGDYTVITPTGVLANVDENGELSRGNWLYFESSDCSGTPYVSDHNLSKAGVGHTYVNPQLETKLQLYSHNGAIYYRAPDADLVALHYSSSGYFRHSTLECDKNTSYRVEMAVKLEENRPEITGLDSLPVVIEGVGKAMTVAAEVGGTFVTAHNVLANGVKIGTIQHSNLPNTVLSSSTSVSGVVLDEFPNRTVRLYKDGSYDADWFEVVSLYYLEENCSGSAYVRFISDADKKWIDTSKISTKEAKNNGSYYALSELTYKASEGMKSYKDNSGNCRNSTSSSRYVYKQATSTAEPTLPTFTPPIIIEGWEDTTSYESLPEAS